MKVRSAYSEWNLENLKTDEQIARSSDARPVQNVTNEFSQKHLLLFPWVKDNGNTPTVCRFESCQEQKALKQKSPWVFGEEDQGRRFRDQKEDA